MKYTYCEALMWHALSPGMFRWLRAQRPDWDIYALKRRTKRIYREMAARTPDIGSLSRNSLRMCLSGGMAWLSAYEAAGGRMDEECCAGMVRASMESPLIKGAFQRKELFTPEAQRRRAESATRGNAISDSPSTGRPRSSPGEIRTSAQSCTASAACARWDGRRGCCAWCRTCVCWTSSRWSGWAARCIAPGRWRPVATAAILHLP